MTDMTGDMLMGLVKVLLIRRGGFEVIERHEIATAKKLKLIWETKDGELILRLETKQEGQANGNHV